MSTILKALRRLEQEREKQAASERLHGEVVAPSSGAGGRRLGPGLGAAVLVGLLAFGAASSWLWMGMPGLDGGAPDAESTPDEPVLDEARADVAAALAADGRPDSPMAAVGRPARQRPVPAPAARTSEPSVPASPAVSPTPALASAPAPAPARSAPPPRVARVPGVVAAGHATLAEEAPAVAASEARTDPTPRAVVPAPTDSTPQVVRARKVTSLPEVPPIDPPRAPAPEAHRVSATPGAAAPPAETAAKRSEPKPSAAPAPTPAASRPSASEQSVLAAASKFSVVRTVWHPTPEKRIAQIADEEGRRIEVHEGDLYEGMIVEEIQLSSVLFRSGDVTFSRRVSARR